MANKIESIKHNDNRAHIPSMEEAGYEDANPKVNTGKTVMSLPKNPVVNRGQDPELFWLGKYGNDDLEDVLKIDIRSLYRQEHIAPEQLIKSLYKTTIKQKNEDQLNIFSTNELFGNALERDELEKVSEYYQHSDGWTNRLIQGDSELVMASLLEREGMAGQVQTIYIDPPYGIAYGSNWQMKLNDRNVKDGRDNQVSGEPEMIKAFRDTWELGIHSYLSYLRNRLLIAQELLSSSGSCFVQISDENVHLVRALMDEVFGSNNFITQIIFKKTGSMSGNFISGIADTILWYGKNKEETKFRELKVKRSKKSEDSGFPMIELENGENRRLNKKELKGELPIPKGRRFQTSPVMSAGASKIETPLIYNGKTYYPSKGNHWKISTSELEEVGKRGRLFPVGNTMTFKRYLDESPFVSLTNIWMDTMESTYAVKRKFVVQTAQKVIERCILMTSDPGDLILDPTSGSGTSAIVSEKWGRRWIAVDTSRIALNISKERLTTATFPSYKLYDSNGDIRQGFEYTTIPHITLKSLASDQPPNIEILFDKPILDSNKLRVSGPFTVETLQNFEPLNPAELENEKKREDSGDFEEQIFEHLKSAGVKNGIKNENAVFIRIEKLADSYLHSEGFYKDSQGKERKAYFHIGPKFGTVAKKAVNEAVKSCRQRGDADWLIILGFSFESDIANQSVTMNVGSFEVTKVRMHDDLMQEGLLKKDKKAASFVTIGEPDIRLHKEGEEAFVEVQGLDIYDPIKDQVKARNIEDIAYWMVDNDYDGNNFVVKQIFFCGGKKDEFKQWEKGLSDLAKTNRKKDVERTLKIEIDDEAFDRLYGFKSHPFIIKKDQKVAVRVISQFGEESTKVLSL